MEQATSKSDSRDQDSCSPASEAQTSEAENKNQAIDKNASLRSTQAQVAPQRVSRLRKVTPRKAAIGCNLDASSNKGHPGSNSSLAPVSVLEKALTPECVLDEPVHNGQEGDQNWHQNGNKVQENYLSATQTLRGIIEQQLAHKMRTTNPEYEEESPKRAYVPWLPSLQPLPEVQSGDMPQCVDGEVENNEDSNEMSSDVHEASSRDSQPGPSKRSAISSLSNSHQEPPTKVAKMSGSDSGEGRETPDVTKGVQEPRDCAVIKMRFCRVRKNENNVRELMHTPFPNGEFEVYKEKNIIDSCEKSATVVEKPKKDFSHMTAATMRNVSIKSARTYELATGKKSESRFHRSEEPVPRSTLAQSNRLRNGVEGDAEMFVCLQTCDKCKGLFQRLARHEYENCASSDVYTCPECDKVFIEFDRFQTHMKLHGMLPVIGITGRSHEQLRLDFAVTPGPSTGYTVNCKFCQMSFNSSERLQKHLEVHHHLLDIDDLVPATEGLDPLRLEGEGLNKDLKMWVRGLKACGKKPFDCQICDKKFVRLVNLKAHLLCFHQINVFKTTPISAKKYFPLSEPEEKPERRVPSGRFDEFEVPVIRSNKAQKVAPEAIHGTVVEPDLPLLQTMICHDEEDASLDRTPPTAAEIDEWIEGLESRDGTLMTCLLCQKPFLSLESLKRHALKVHKLSGIFSRLFDGDETNQTLRIPASQASHRNVSLQVEDRWAGMSEIEKLRAQTKLLCQHLVDPDTLAAFDFESGPVETLVARLLEQMGYSYCWFDESKEEKDKEEEFGGFCRNVRTLILACVAPEVRDRINFDAEKLETILDNLLKEIDVC